MIIKLKDILDLIDINRENHEQIRLIIGHSEERTNTSSILLNGDILDRTVVGLGAYDDAVLEIYLKEDEEDYD